MPPGTLPIDVILQQKLHAIILPLKLRPSESLSRLWRKLDPPTFALLLRHTSLSPRCMTFQAIFLQFPTAGKVKRCSEPKNCSRLSYQKRILEAEVQPLPALDGRSHLENSLNSQSDKTPNQY
jgi:hypothetical protein